MVFLLVCRAFSRSRFFKEEDHEATKVPDRRAGLVVVDRLTGEGSEHPGEKDVKFALDFIPLGRHAPWYVALAKGYFKEEKLNVSILPTKGTADAVRYIESGLSEFGFIDIPSLVASGSGGLRCASSPTAIRRRPTASSAWIPAPT
ncbi:ABC transporter substrate-binding protein [Ottowia sp. VDI28]